MSEKLEFILEIVNNDDCGKPPSIDKLIIQNNKVWGQHQYEYQQCEIPPSGAIDLILGLDNINEYHKDDEIIYFLQACRYLQDKNNKG